MAITPVFNSAELDKALRLAQASDVISLNTPIGNEPYTIEQHVGSLRWSAPVTVTRAPGSAAILDCSKNAYISGVKNLTLKNLNIVGRMNFDAITNPNDSGDLRFEGCHFTDAPGRQENLKLTGLDRVTITQCQFKRTGVGTWDRFIDAVSVNKLCVLQNYFERGHAGSIQSKGGGFDTEIAYNYFNQGGDRPIQLGGSTCPKCWRNPNKPAPDGYESLYGLVHDNIIVGGLCAFVLSTQLGGKVYNNTFWAPAYHPVSNANGSHGGTQYLFRLLQEADPNLPPGLMKPNAAGEITNNLFLYPVQTEDGRAGINAQVTNWAANGEVDFTSFKFFNNAVYACSPIVNPGFGPRGIYPHRHPVTDMPTTPYNWKVGMLDQVYPEITGWGTPMMRPKSFQYDMPVIGCRVNSHKIGPDDMQLTPEVTPNPPIKHYTGDVYGWVYPGAPDQPPAEPIKRPRYFVMPGSGVGVAAGAFDTQEQAQDWLLNAQVVELTEES